MYLSVWWIVLWVFPFCCKHTWHRLPEAARVCWYCNRISHYPHTRLSHCWLCTHSTCCTYTATHLTRAFLVTVKEVKQEGLWGMLWRSCRLLGCQAGLCSLLNVQLQLGQAVPESRRAKWFSKQRFTGSSGTQVSSSTSGTVTHFCSFHVFFNFGGKIL